VAGAQTAEEAVTALREKMMTCRVCRHKDRPAIERMMMLGCSRKVWNLCEKVR